MVKILLPVFTIVLVSLFIFLSFKSSKIKQSMVVPSPTSSGKQSQVDSKKETIVVVGDTEIQVEIADNMVSRGKGLSGIETLEENRGMLFVFPGETRGSFWMKGMQIPLDIIWISNGQVNQITKDVPPPESGTSMDNLKLYVPDDPYEYVIEVNAGFADRHGISPGDKVKILSNT